MSYRSPISEQSKRIIRQEAFFGCVVCGNPLIQYAHIIPYEVSRDNSPSNLVALCPNDHSRYDLGAISRRRIRELKSDPYNRGRNIEDRFDVEGDVPVVNAGGNIFKNTPVLLVVDHKNIVSLTKDEKGLTLNAQFYDENNNLLAFIKNNEWCALSDRIWDIEYHTVAKALVLRTRPRNILLRLRIHNEIVYFYGHLFYNGIRVRISPNRIIFGDKMMTWHHVEFHDIITAIAFDTQTGGLTIGTSTHEHEFSDPVTAVLRRGGKPIWENIYESHFIMKQCKICGKIEL